jgi:hypothetical protein
MQFWIFKVFFPESIAGQEMLPHDIETTGSVYMG